MTDPEPCGESLTEVAATGDTVATLRALRDLLAVAIEAGPPARDLAALSRRLLEVVNDISRLTGEDAWDAELDQMLSTPTMREGSADDRS